MSLPPLPKPWSAGLAMFSKKQMLEYGRACRAAALEEAAKVCDAYEAFQLKHGDIVKHIAGQNLAEDIRALKGEL